VKILIDLQACQSGSRLGGIGRYSKNLAWAMVKTNPGHDIHFLLSGLLHDGLIALSEELRELVDISKIHIADLPGPVFASDNSNDFRSNASEIIREYFVAQLQPDVLYIASLIEGWGDNVTSSVGRVFPAERVIVTLYDLIPLIDESRYLADEALRAHYMSKLDYMQKAGLLLSISDYSREEAIEHLEVSNHDVVNISTAIDSFFCEDQAGEPELAKLTAKHSITGDFLLYTGSFDARKNHHTLIEAFARLPTELLKSLQLVIVGNGWDSAYENLYTIAAENGLDREKLLFTGKVSDQELRLLYRNCALFVFPSLREGFGLPVLEAMACGAPVIASNTTSVPEVVNNEEALFDPSDKDAIANKMERVLTDKEFKDLLIAKGLKQAKNFSWEKSAITAWAAIDSHYERLVDRPVLAPLPKLEVVIDSISDQTKRSKVERSDILSSAICIANNQAAIANNLDSNNNSVGVVTTWNTKCGIASYAKYQINHFPENVTVFAPRVSELNEEDEDFVKRCWSIEPPDQLQILESNILAENIRSLVIQFNYGFFDFSALGVFLEKILARGIKVFFIFHSTTDPVDWDASKRLAFLLYPLSKCSKLLIHSAEDYQRLQNMGLNNIQLLPHGINEYRNIDYQLKNVDTVTVGTFGFFLPHKGLQEFVEAVALLEKSGLKLKVVMLNAEYPVIESSRLIEETKAQISQLGLDQTVELYTEYFSEEECLNHLSHLDLLVFPYQETGESSSAAVRMGIASGKPVAVTPLSIFSDVEDVVFRLGGVSPEDMCKSILALFEDSQKNRKVRKARQDKAEHWCNEHQFSSVANVLWDTLITDEMEEAPT